jgi:transcriptional regulator with PAS, ATPase and Fis domain
VTDLLVVNAVLGTVSDIFASLGRILICLDSDFHIVHASGGLAVLLDGRSVESLEGTPAAALLGEALFGRTGTLRAALEAGETREGWRATIRKDDGEVLLSLTAAPFRHRSVDPCDPRVRYILVLRPALDAIDEAGAPLLFGGMIARSPAMGHLFQLIEHLKSSEATVLLTGESGTGKEMVARAIHDYSPRRRGPFVAVNCGAIPADLLESELFGHVRGAFTGAVRDRAGRFEVAGGGTLFLDEVGDMPLPLQVKLLRVLQERTFEPVGESRSRNANARVIAATNVELRRAVREGTFREDLYYRLRVVPIEIPPLRERREDIEPLARNLLTRISARHGRQMRFSPDTIRRLLRHTWPGNVRELENAIEYAVAVSAAQTIMPEDLPIDTANPVAPAAHGVVRSADPNEAAQIRAALEEHRWRRDEAARALGISRTTLWRKIREYRLT